ncbi:hypothetical protein SUGI_1182940 [Cryptomeria japonica]|nr:hypothetical protein SUGI_1182940 [Cryptomeria japonica]
MNLHQTKEFELSNFSSISFQPDKSYKNSLDFYIRECSADGFDYPYLNKFGKKAGGQPTKQIIHKMIERQRRKEMNSLYSELWSLLPQESIREKRSVADQLEEAANYVRYLEQQLKDLTRKEP